MRLNAIVRVREWADLFTVMKRTPLLPSLALPLAGAAILLTSLLAGTPAVRAQEAPVKEPAPKVKKLGVDKESASEGPAEPVRKVAAVDPALLSAPSASDESVLLRNLAGQEIRAELISAHGDSVLVRRAEDRREFLVPLANLDEYSVGRVRNWMDSDPQAVSFSLSINTTRNLVKTSDFMTSGKEYKTAEWSYRVTVTNQSRNELTGATLEYRIIYDDAVEFAKSVVNPGKGRNQQEGQAVELPTMAYNDQIDFDTPAVAMQTYKFVPSRGEKEYFRDQIKGIWIRVIRHGEVIGEYQSSPAQMGSLFWDNENELEIRVTNRFRDQFSTSSPGR